MPDVREFQTVVASAERAAGNGDFVLAEALLREAAALQEAAVGAQHPDLASTFNNLAVACERANKPADAEHFYRRAYAIAAAAFGPEHALVVTSRENLRDFCHSQQLPVDEWALGTGANEPPRTITIDSADDSLNAFGPPDPPAPVPAPPVAAAPVRQPAPPWPSPASTVQTARPPARTEARRPAPRQAARRPGGNALRAFATAVGLVLLLATLSVAWLWFGAGAGTNDAPAASRARGNGSTSGATAPAPAASGTTAPAPRAPQPVSAAPVPEGAAEATTPTPAAAAAPAAAATESAAAPAAPLPTSSGTRASAAPDAPATAAGDDAVLPVEVRVVTATMCETLSTSGAWQCDPVGADSRPGRYSYFTRIAAPRAVRVRHRWYQGDTLRQDVVLTVGANASAGYRTFSRQTVTPGDWHVELRADNGALLDDTRFVVR